MANDRILNIAHRGARSLAPENTLLAARKAVAVGADMWELDVNMTSDGEMVIIHDDTLERTSNASEALPDRSPWRVSDFTLEELRKLDFGTWYIHKDPYQQIANGAVTQGELERFGGTCIPTLREALEFTRDYHWRLNVEIKDLTGTPGDAVIVRKVIELIDSLNMASSVLLSSFNHEYMHQAKEINPMIATGALIEAPVENPAALLKRIQAQALNPDITLVTPELVQSLRADDFDVFVWTVNDPDDMRRMIDLGVSGIITDFPQELHKILK